MTLERGRTAALREGAKEMAAPRNRKARKAHCPRADFDNMHDTRFRTYRLFRKLPRTSKTSEIFQRFQNLPKLPITSKNFQSFQKTTVARKKESPGEPGLESRAPAHYRLFRAHQRERQHGFPVAFVNPLPVLERHVEVVGPVTVQGESDLVP